MGAISQSRALRIGAVAYDPKVVTIWEGFKTYFESRNVPMDYILYSSYDAQVEAHISGEIQVAWNSPLAWVKSQIITHGTCRAVAMRDSDRDLTTKIIVRSDARLATLSELKGKTVAVGAWDSPQATLIPLAMIADSGVDPRKDCRVLYHDVMVGKHGDHIGGERDAVKSLSTGLADAACLLDGNYPTFINEGTLDPGTTRVLATTPPFDHCNFTVRRDLPEEPLKEWVETLLAMSFQDQGIRLFMELEGLQKWLPGRTTGYAQLEKAVDRFSFYRSAASTTGN
jgi:phosphonate transport system substrate-binding protein